MEIKRPFYGDELWQSVAQYANACSWKTTGEYFSNRMQNNGFIDWESVFVALEDNNIVGFCALSKTSSVFGDTYTPNIGFLFVGESYRGNKISERLCMSAIEHAKTVGFDKAYLYSDLVNFYEKYGFVKIDEKDAPWGVRQSIYMYNIV